MPLRPVVHPLTTLLQSTKIDQNAIMYFPYILHWVYILLRKYFSKNVSNLSPATAFQALIFFGLMILMKN